MPWIALSEKFLAALFHAELSTEATKQNDRDHSKPNSYAGFLIYGLCAFGWLYAMRHMKLAMLGVVYSLATVLPLAVLGLLVFGEPSKIYELRLKAELTQAQLAEKADVSNDTISRIERDLRCPSVDVKQMLA